MSKKSIYEPVKDQFKVLLEYIKILEKKRVDDSTSEIYALMEFIDTVKRQCEIYLKYELIKLGKKNG
jgi:hypothetical protein